MKPMYHAESSMKKYGGQTSDYMPIHDFMDSSKASLADVRHRAVLHSAFGIYLVERVFGPWIVNSAGKRVPTRSVAEDHVMEDVGFIPTLEHWLRNMRIEDWMNGGRVHVKTKRRFIPMAD